MIISYHQIEIYIMFIVEKKPKSRSPSRYHVHLIEYFPISDRDDKFYVYDSNKQRWRLDEIYVEPLLRTALSAPTNNHKVRRLQQIPSQVPFFHGFQILQNNVKYA